MSNDSRACFDVIVCDDVRKEDNGKAILIGVYTGSIVVDSFEFLGRFSLWFRFPGLEKGEHSNTVTISHNGDVLHTLKGNVVSSDEEIPQGFVFNLPLHLKKAGTLEFQAEFENGDTVTAPSLLVLEGPK